MENHSTLSLQEPDGFRRTWPTPPDLVGINKRAKGRRVEDSGCFTFGKAN
jgi:hypothetical protein